MKLPSFYFASLTFSLCYISKSVSALGFDTFFGGEEEDIPELSDAVDVYSGHEVEAGSGAYGYDVSFPIMNAIVSDNYPWLPHNVDPENNPVPDRYKNMPLQILGDKQKPYDELLQGCKSHYVLRRSACTSTENDRIEMNKRQPPSMQNYTELGFKKIKAPPDIFEVIKEFWEKNKDNQSPENWNAGNTYTNHWVSPTTMISVENNRLRGGGVYLKNKIWSLAKETLQQWTGEELTPCSLYGIRVYSEGSVLATHVDRMPLVSSAILNVAQDLDEPWPLEVYGHDGNVYNVTMEPGDMVLYESHSILHGRPFPLKGRFYANIFIHFEPVGHSLRHNQKHNPDPDAQYQESVKNKQGGHENNDGLPAYIVKDSVEAARWKRTHVKDWEPTETTTTTTGSTDAHQAAGFGDVESLKSIARREKTQLTAKDSNGWAPIHEGARAGHTEVLKILVEHGADVNERTQNGLGGSPLYYAKENHGKKHASVKYLESLGAKYLEPEL